MKIQIDTNNKTIQILENIKIGVLLETLFNMLGEDYKEYTLNLEQTTYTYYPWVYPIIVPYQEPTWPI